MFACKKQNRMFIIVSLFKIKFLNTDDSLLLMIKPIAS